jgi:formylglycine-generating enzyme required for sulfatase activity/serine/threonine protein kinase
MGFKPGDSLNEGNYVIERQLSAENYSGFGITYKATDRGLNRSVVLKLPNSALCHDPEYLSFLDSFQEEAKTLGRLVGDRHPHIVQVYAAFPVKVAGRDEPVLCIVMEYIDGTDLYRQVHRVNDRQQVEIHPLMEPEALGYIQQIGSALAHLHRYEPKPIVHRDVKPANIMVRRSNNQAVLIDFGLARTFTPNVTKKHTVAYSQGYAPPEQYLPQAQRGAYTDVYGLAATLYFLVTGQHPPAANNRGSSLYQFGQDLLDSPQKLNPNVSDRVNQAILLGMELKPHDRPQSVGEWLQKLGLGSGDPAEIPGMPHNFTKPTVRVPGMGPALSDNWREELGPPQPDPLVEGLREAQRQRQAAEAQRQREAAEAQRKAAEQRKQLTFTLPQGGGTLEFVWVPGGELVMVDGKHRVQVPKFRMGKYPITQRQYQAIMGENPSHFTGNDLNPEEQNKGLTHLDRPVERVTWHQAMAFCQKLTQTLKIEGYEVHLPSETMWEWAARDGENSGLTYGGSNDLDQVGWYSKNSDSKTHPVGQKQANKLGIHNMSGNVWEWCWDNWSSGSNVLLQNGKPLLKGGDNTYRAVRGGSCYDVADSCRSGFRVFNYPGNRNDGQGFRVVLLPVGFCA